jgi:U3 small nucleolar RNA-associated protein 25
MDTSSQPINRHLDRMISEKTIKIIKEIHEAPKLKENFEIEQFKWPRLGTLSYLKPMIEENQDAVINLLSPEELEQAINVNSVGSHANETGDAGVGKNVKLDEFQVELLSLLRTYKDLLYANETLDTLDSIQQVYVLHVLNHLMSSRSRIISNNKVFERKTICDNILQDDPKLRDQGFTRTRVLFLLPFRYSALRVGKCIANYLSNSNYNIHNLERFIQEFGDDDGVDSTTRPVPSDGNKPNDFYQTFHGNIDDSFRVGLKLTKKSLRFFSDFYDSDIIIASPLGLKTVITMDEQKASLAGDSEQLPLGGEKDFLSSVEIVILDQAEIFLMQNWEHVIDIMQHINVMPAKPRKMDISRVRLWHLENWSKYYRQLIMFTSITVPLVHSFFQTHSLNYEGYIAFKHRIDHPQAKEISSKCTQHFLYFDSASAKEACDQRFSFFIKNVLPKFTGSASNASGESSKIDHTLILVSSYFDYVRLRNYFRREKLSFTQICEYNEDNKVAKARQLFYFGARQFLLYTERCHFYHRYKIKGIRNIIFYEPPTFPKFYSEMLNMLTPELQGKKFDESSSHFTATTLFSNHDTLQLGALIGFSNAVKLIQNKKSIT